MRGMVYGNPTSIEWAIQLNNPHLQGVSLENNLLCVLVVLRVLKKWGKTVEKKDYKELRKSFEQTLKEMYLKDLKYDDVFLDVLFGVDYTDFSWPDFYAQHCRFIYGLDYVLHKNLTKELEKVFTPQSKKCLVVNAESFILQLEGLVQNNPGVHFYFSCSSRFNKKILGEMFRDYVNVKILDDNVFDYTYCVEEIGGFDVALITTGSGKLSKWVKGDPDSMFDEKKGKYFYQLGLDLIHQYMDEGCRIAAVVPAQFQFVGEETKILRENIATNYKIEEIALLPDDATFGNGLQMVLLEYEACKVDNGNVVLKKYKKEGIDWTTDFTHRMPQTTLLNMDVWSDVWQKDFDGWYGNTPRKKIRLGDVAEIFRGKAIKPSGNKHILVNIGDIREYKLYFDEPAFCEGDDRRLAQYALQDGDVVMPARGSYLRAAPFYGEKVGLYGRMYIASSNIIVIRPDRSKINSRFLALLLGSSEGNELIRGVQQGNKIMTLGYENLKELRLEFPELEEQNEIAANFEKAFAEYEQSINAAERKWLNARFEMRNKLWKKQGEKTND